MDVPEEPGEVQPTCSECGGPLGDDSYVFQTEDGSLLPVCSRCATAGAGEGTSAAEPEPDRVPVDSALQLFQDMIDRRASEADDLRALARLVDELSKELELWRGRAEGLRDRFRSLEAELERTRDRLHATEELVALGAPPLPSAESQPAEAGAPRQAPVQPRPAPGPLLTLEQVRTVQRVFNETKFVEKLRSVRRGLGKPQVSLAAVAGPEPRVMITVIWDIVWYQYLVNLTPGLTEDEQVTAFAEGMEPSELAGIFKVDNAVLDDSGRVDASEMEVGLLDEGTELLTDMPAERAAAIDDATEEIWDQHSKPEFRWDD
jgi:hypothetical protein